MAMKKLFLLTILFSALLITSCRPKDPAILKVFVRSATNQLVNGARVVVIGDQQSNPPTLEFVDTSITDSVVPSTINLNEPFLEVGTTSTGVNSSMLIKIPMPIEMHPENASVIDARITLESTPLSATGIPIAVRSILKPWDENANSIRYNSTNNWSELGGRGISSDVSSPLDIQNSVNGDMSWDTSLNAKCRETHSDEQVICSKSGKTHQQLTGLSTEGKRHKQWNTSLATAYPVKICDYIRGALVNPLLPNGSEVTIQNTADQSMVDSSTRFAVAAKDELPPLDHYLTHLPKHPGCLACHQCKKARKSCRDKERD